MNKVIIIGGGAAGMVAAISAAMDGCEVHVYEKNEKLGKKVFITGKGRCNVTNACDMEELFAGVVNNRKFLYSAFYGFANTDMMTLLEDCGCKLKIERGNRVFPVSDKSWSVINALSDRMDQLGVKVHLFTEVKELIIEDNACKGIVIKKTLKREMADAVIVATGGLSYPSTGSTGDGYKFAEETGHMITPLSPALVPVNVREIGIVKELQGLSLRNIQASVYKGKKLLYSEFGEMLFTHFGVSGPVILSASSFIAEDIKKTPLSLVIDLKPALTIQQLDLRILREFEEVKNKQFKNSLVHLYPGKMLPVMLEIIGIDIEKKVNEITKEERMRIIENTKNFTLTLQSLRDYNEAIITQGGVSVKDINPSTMESKRVSRLCFAGEVLDLDAVTGGYNLQIAWSTGWLAGKILSN